MITLALVACSTPDALPEPTAAPPQEKSSDADRVVTIGPAIAEIALALAPDRVVGLDSASAELNADLPAVGHSRALSVEGVLSLEPTLVLTNNAAGPPDAMTQLEGAVTVETLAQERTVAGVRTLIQDVATALDADPSALLKDLDASCDGLPSGDPKSTALFVYARGGGTMNVSGTDTAAHAMFALAGLGNAVTGYEGYKPLTPEAAVAADPDWVVFTTRGLEALGGVAGVQGVPGLAQLPAVVEGRVTDIDDFDLLAFGLDTCTGAKKLAAATTP